MIDKLYYKEMVFYSLMIGEIIVKIGSRPKITSFFFKRTVDKNTAAAV